LPRRLQGWFVSSWIAARSHSYAAPDLITRYLA